MRRAYLAAPALALSLFVSGFFACSQSSNPTAPPGPDAAVGDAGAEADAWPPTPAAWDRPVTRPDDQTATMNRAACTYDAGSLPGETLGPTVPVDTDIPIDTIVVMIQENHSFDQYYSHLNTYAMRSDIESASDTTTNPTMVGGGDAGPPSEAGAGEGGAADGGAADAAPHVY